MNILVMGGTYFLGIHIVSELEHRNHNVVLFNRSTFGDRNTDDIQILKGKTFDCVIDISGYTEKQVSSLIDVIHKTIPYYIFISSTLIDIVSILNCIIGSVYGILGRLLLVG